jgi:hypothetical protein
MLGSQNTIDVAVDGTSIVLALHVAVAVTLTASEGCSYAIGIIGACLCARLITLCVLAREITSVEVNTTRQREGPKISALKCATIVLGARVA